MSVAPSAVTEPTSDAGTTTGAVPRRVRTRTAASGGNVSSRRTARSAIRPTCAPPASRTGVPSSSLSRRYCSGVVVPGTCSRS